MNARTVGWILALVAIAAIAVIAITTPNVPPVVAAALVAVPVAGVVISHLRTAKLVPVVLDALRAKGPMTVTQVARAIDRPNDRLRVIAALARLRAHGTVTRAPLEAEVPDGDPRDSHLYRVA